MNPNYTEFKFPQIKAHPWHKIFHKWVPPEAVDLVSRLLPYSPNLRCTALEALAHTFFDEPCDPNAHFPNGRPLPPFFNFRPQELKGVSSELLNKLLPKHAEKQCPFTSLGFKSVRFIFCELYPICYHCTLYLFSNIYLTRELGKPFGISINPLYTTFSQLCNQLILPL